MTVTMLYITNIKEVTGKREEKVRLEGSTLGDLINLLIAKYGPRFRELALSPDGQEVGDEIALLINGQSYHTLGGLKAELKDNDTLLMGMTAVGG